jgi:hypothetical protein
MPWMITPDVFPGRLAIITDRSVLLNNCSFQQFLNKFWRIHNDPQVEQADKVQDAVHRNTGPNPMRSLVQVTQSQCQEE